MGTTCKVKEGLSPLQLVLLAMMQIETLIELGLLTEDFVTSRRMTPGEFAEAKGILSGTIAANMEIAP